MSIVGGPPLIHSRMQAFWFFFISSACARTCWMKFRAGSVATLVAMCCIKCRRFMPKAWRRSMSCSRGEKVERWSLIEVADLIRRIGPIGPINSPHAVDC